MRVFEFEIISDILNSKSKVLKKNAVIKKLFNLDNIIAEEYIDDKTGKPVKKYCLIYDNNIPYKINKPYEDVKKVILDRSIPVLGFAHKSKRYK
jgi:hypothetical protein